MWAEQSESVDIKSLQALNLLYTFWSGLLWMLRRSEPLLVSDMFDAIRVTWFSTGSKCIHTSSDGGMWWISMKTASCRQSTCFYRVDFAEMWFFFHHRTSQSLARFIYPNPLTRKHNDCGPLGSDASGSCTLCVSDNSSLTTKLWCFFYPRFSLIGHYEEICQTGRKMPENLIFLTQLMAHNSPIKFSVKKLKLWHYIFSSLWENVTYYIYIVYLYALIL